MAAIKEDGEEQDAVTSVGRHGHGSPGHWRAINVGNERSLTVICGHSAPQVRPCDRRTVQIPKPIMRFNSRHHANRKAQFRTTVPGLALVVQAVSGVRAKLAGN